MSFMAQSSYSLPANPFVGISGLVDEDLDRIALPQLPKRAGRLLPNVSG